MRMEEERRMEEKWRMEEKDEEGGEKGRLEKEEEGGEKENRKGGWRRKGEEALTVCLTSNIFLIRACMSSRLDLKFSRVYN